MTYLISAILRTVITLSVLVGIALFSSANLSAQEPKQIVPIIVITDKGQTVFKVELAITVEQRTTGLMFRRSMERNYGMLFDFQNTRMVMMWMKNTFLPLDMVFIDENGKIAHIAKNTTPQSLDVISSNVPVRYVLEINAGVSDEKGLEVGQVLQLPNFSAYK